MDPEQPQRLAGRLKGNVWERFNRLQASVAAVLGSRRHPGGAFKFRTYEQLAQWNRQVSLPPPEPPTATISSDSAAN